MNRKEATKQWVDKWRKDNNLSPNAIPAKEKVPYKWMHPFLHKVKKKTRKDLKIT